MNSLPPQTRGIVRSLPPYHPGSGAPGALKLSSNENPLGASPAALEAAAKRMRDPALYPDAGVTALRDAISARHGLSPEHVVVGNGSDEVMLLAALAFGGRGSRTVSSQTTFSQYRFVTEITGGALHTVPLTGTGAVDPRAMLRAVDYRTTLVFVCSPNNPTGAIVEAQSLIDLISGVPPTTTVVVDHAYAEYVEPELLDRSEELIHRYPNLVVLRTFSKVFGLAAFRVGYGIAQPQTIEALARVRFPFNVNAPGQAAAAAALADTAFVEQSLQANQRFRADLLALLSGYGAACLPAHGNFVTAAVPGGATAFAAATREAGVTIRALDSFGLTDHVRITVPGTAQQWTRLEQALAHAFSSAQQSEEPAPAGA